MATSAIILAAGEGTRMKSNHPKVMHKIMGHPLVWWAVRSAKQSGADNIIVVVGNGADEVRNLLKDEEGVVCVEQTERLGTGHAVKSVLDQVEIEDGCVVVLNGDSPLVQPETISALANTVNADNMSASVLTMTPADVTGYGRIALDEAGHVTAIIEHKDCTEEQRQTLLECNSGVYAFNASDLKNNINKIDNNNVQGEYYLTDMISILREADKKVSSVHVDDYTELLGVNSRVQLAEATKIMQARRNEEIMMSGVTMIDPSTVWIDVDVTVGKDTIIWPMTFLMGDTHIGEDCTVGPNTRLTNTTCKDNCTIDETVAVDAVLENNVNCGPRAYLRPGAHLLDNSKAGTHVEIKNSTIGVGSKVPHLSYIGDTTMGNDVNIGAGSITCNYDGKNKHHTNIGDNVFVGSDTMMVAPVNIGDRAVLGASSCITRDVPADALGIERSEQHIVSGYAIKKAQKN